MNLIKQLEQEEIEQVLADKIIPPFAPGDTVVVSVKGNTEKPAIKT